MCRQNKTSNNIIEYDNHKYAQIETLFKIQNKIYAIIQKYKTIERNILIKPFNDKVRNALDKIYKFVVKTNEIELIDIERIKVKCILIDIKEEFYYLTNLVELDIYN